MKRADIASAIELIDAVAVHEAAKDMAMSLKLDAQVQTIVGKWNERGQITGWTKTSNTPDRPVTVLVEVFVSDIAGEEREFDRYVRLYRDLEAGVEKLREAAQAILDRKQSTFRARNGRQVGIQGDDGEMCWIVHSDEIAHLEGALAALSTPSEQEER